MGIRINMGNRTAAIAILVTLELVFFTTAVLLANHGAQIADKVWEAFTGLNGALLLILKADADSHKSNPQQPEGPAKE
jgi:hypothetical protein